MSRKSNKKPSRSNRLKKFEGAYQTYLNKFSDEPCKKIKSPRKKPVIVSSPKRKKPTKSPRTKLNKLVTSPQRKPRNVEKSSKNVTKSSKKQLNAYQLFVQEESKKAKYSGMSGKDRMLSISQAWKKKTKKRD
jgi:hypothetical protein